MNKKSSRHRRPRWARYVVGVCAFVLVLVWLLQRWPGEGCWLSVLLAYAPPFIWLGPLAPALFASIFGRDRLAGLTAGLLLVFTLLALMGLQLSLPARPRDGERIVVATWNVHREHGRVAEVKAELERLGPDIVFLQEAGGAWQDTLSDWNFAGHGRQWVFVRNEIQDCRIQQLGQSWRPAFAVNTSVGSQTVGLIDVHLTVAGRGQSLRRARGARRAYLCATARARREQIESIAAWAQQQTGPFIIAGDFNTPPGASVWNPLVPLATNAFAARGYGFGYTFPSSLPIWRIDHIWPSPHWRVLRCGTFGGTISDHLGVWAELELRH